MTNKKYQHLTDEQVDHFMDRGYVVLKGAFTKVQAADWTKDLWIRVALDPNDKTTWTTERLHLPALRRQKVKDFCPKAWGAICDLLGGEDRIDEYSSSWGDSFILNLGAPQYENQRVTPKELDNWHSDGDFFLHFLDSPEQALLIIPVFSDIVEGGGGTYIAPGSIGPNAKHLAAHPEGLLPGMGSGPRSIDYRARLEESGDDFVELTGNIGDVILMHPLMLHSASKNSLRRIRIITNPPAALKEPFNFNRENPDDFSLVELKTLKALGKERYDFKPAVPRERLVPARVGIQGAAKKLELERLKEHAVQHGLPIPEICV